MGHSWDLTEEEKKNIKPEEALENCKEPQIDEIIIGYNKYILDLGGEFLKFAEAYNEALETVKRTGTIISTLKVRIKDFSSAHSNTEKKELDDMFGMEIATPTEIEKEKIILFNEILFTCTKSKEWKKTEKEGGYSAFHNTGYAKAKDFENLQEKIIEIIENTETEQWTTSSKNKKERKKIKVFRHLKEEIKNEKNLSRLTTITERMLKKIIERDIDFNKLPVMECRFLTLEKQREAIIGNAAHYKYKNGIEEHKIREMYENGKLFRGINLPWKWNGSENGLELQKFDETVEQNWPFLSEVIQENRYNGNSETTQGEAYDVQFAKIFPFLIQYVSGATGQRHEDIKKRLIELTAKYRINFSKNKDQEK